MTKLGITVEEVSSKVKEYSKYGVTIGKICRFCDNAEPLSITSLPYGARIWCKYKCTIFDNYCTCDGYTTERYEEVIEEE